MANLITPEIEADIPPIQPVSPDNPLMIGGQRVDGRTALARRYRDLCAALASDLGGQPTVAQAMLIRRAAGLAVQCETMERSLAAGGAVHEDKYTKLVNTLGRVLGMLGLQRVARDAGPVFDAHTAALMEGEDDDA